MLINAPHPLTPSPQGEGVIKKLRYNEIQQLIKTKMTRYLFTLFFVLQTVTSFTQSITNLTVTQRQDGSGKVDVHYTLSGEADAYNITAEVSLDNGNTWQSITNLNGDMYNVSPGNHQLVWNAGAEMPGEYVNNARIKLTSNESGGITGQPCPGLPTVTYAGQTYNTVYIGSQCWLKENLNVGTMISGTQNQTNNGIIEKYCYNNDPANCATYGGLYQWNEAMQYVTTEGTQGICPDGWHIPTDGEYTVLTNFLGGESVAGGKMKSTGTIEEGTGLWYQPNTGATDESGFSGFPGGYRYGLNGYFYILGYHGLFWSSSQYNTNYAWRRYLNYYYANVYRYNYYKEDGFSVRCLRD